MAGQLALTAGAPRLPIPVLATRSFASAAGAHPGEILPLPVGNASVPVRLVAEVRAFPGTGGTAPAVIIDQSWLQQALAAQSQPPLPVTQWWLAGRPGPPPGLPAGASVVTWAGSAARLLGDPLPNVSQVSLLVIVAAAGLLACVGFVVSVVAAIRERRLQHALLAALGVGRAARAGQLSLEQLMLSVPGAVAGAVIGAALAYLLVPAVTLTPGGEYPLPAGARGDPAGLDRAAGAGHRGGAGRGGRRRGRLPARSRGRAASRGDRMTPGNVAGADRRRRDGRDRHRGGGQPGPGPARAGLRVRRRRRAPGQPGLPHRGPAA